VALLGEIAHERGAGVLLVTHDTEAAHLADHSFTLRDGELHKHTPEDTEPMASMSARGSSSE
jgi:ABC-type lipoprotein export system ATPase subunit